MEGIGLVKFNNEFGGSPMLRFRKMSLNGMSLEVVKVEVLVEEDGPADPDTEGDISEWYMNDLEVDVEWKTRWDQMELMIRLESLCETLEKLKPEEKEHDEGSLMGEREEEMIRREMPLLEGNRRFKTWWKRSRLKIVWSKRRMKEFWKRYKTNDEALGIEYVLGGNESACESPIKYWRKVKRKSKMKVRLKGVTLDMREVDAKFNRFWKEKRWKSNGWMGKDQFEVEKELKLEGKEPEDESVIGGREEDYSGF
jgi:hypothetical protein